MDLDGLIFWKNQSDHFRGSAVPGVRHSPLGPHSWCRPHDPALLAANARLAFENQNGSGNQSSLGEDGKPKRLEGVGWCLVDISKVGLSLGLLSDPFSSSFQQLRHMRHTRHCILMQSKEAQKVDLLPTSSYNASVFARCALASLWVVDPNLVSQRYAK